MKHTRIIILTTLVTLCAFFAAIQSSCKKDKCKGVVCTNTGVCKDGKCTCPTGYFGKSCDSTSMTFTSQAPTPLIVAVNGVSTTLPLDSSVTYQAKAGSGIFISVYTAVTNTAKKLVGKEIAWSFTRLFPANGAIYPAEMINIKSDNFFLRLANHSIDQSIVLIYVNYQNPHSQTYDTLNVPNDGKIYDIGYYERNSSTVIYANGNRTGVHWMWKPVLKDTVNSTDTVIAY